MFRKSKKAAGELRSVPSSPRRQEEGLQAIDYAHQQATFETWLPFDKADATYSFEWGGYEALFLGVHVSAEVSNLRARHQPTHPSNHPPTHPIPPGKDSDLHFSANPINRHQRVTLDHQPVQRRGAGGAACR
jgi:hypothetical protein